MRLNSKGQVTIPAELRRKHHFHEGDEVDGGRGQRDDCASCGLSDAETRGQRLVRRDARPGDHGHEHGGTDGAAAWRMSDAEHRPSPVATWSTPVSCWTS